MPAAGPRHPSRPIRPGLLTTSSGDAASAPRRSCRDSHQTSRRGPRSRAAARRRSRNMSGQRHQRLGRPGDALGVLPSTDLPAARVQVADDIVPAYSSGVTTHLDRHHRPEQLDAGLRHHLRTASLKPHGPCDLRTPAPDESTSCDAPSRRTASFQSLIHAAAGDARPTFMADSRMPFSTDGIYSRGCCYRPLISSMR